MKLQVPMLKHSGGRESASFTMAFIAFNLVALWLVLWLFSGIIGYQVPEFDGGSAMAFLTPVMANYFLRRKTEKEVAND